MLSFVCLSVDVPEWSKGQDLGSCISLRGFKSHRLHFIFSPLCQLFLPDPMHADWVAVAADLCCPTISYISLQNNVFVEYFM